MSIRSLQRELDQAERHADEPGIPDHKRRARLAKVERLRNQISAAEARDARKLEERGARASRSRW